MYFVRDQEHNLSIIGQNNPGGDKKVVQLLKKLPQTQS